MTKTLAEQIIQEFGLIRFEVPENIIGVNIWEDTYDTNSNRFALTDGWRIFENPKTHDCYFVVKHHSDIYLPLARIESVEHFKEILNALGIVLA